MSDAPKDPFLVPPSGAPQLDDVAQAMTDLCITVAWLRDPAKGCPWDLKQTHASLKRFMIEEAYEAAEAMNGVASSNLCEELGDVLLQVVLNAQVALDQKSFNLVDVIHSINSKMRRRHPHVFASESTSDTQISPLDLKRSWETIKAEEKREKGPATESADVFREARGKHPATLQAQAIGKIAARIDFDWSTPQEVFEQVQSEMQELSEELESPEHNLKFIAAEIGDVYFSLAQLCRHFGLDPEVTSLEANLKFLRRFAAAQRLAEAAGQDVSTVGRESLEKLWVQAKKEEKQQGI